MGWWAKTVQLDLSRQVTTLFQLWWKAFTVVDQVTFSPGEPKLGPQAVGAMGVRITLLLAVAVLGGAFALSKLLTTFEQYDDEGYLLLSLRHYLNGGHLYTDTFTQYGPFYYFAQWIFFRVLHFPVTHDGGRLVTLVYWLLSALLAGLFVQRISKSLLLGAAAGLGFVTAGAFLANEPGHPQQVVLLLWMTASYLSLPLAPSDRTTLRMFWLGAVAAALLFTKVNVGVFFIAALVNALVCVITPGRIRLLGVSLSILYAVTVPYFLMHFDFYRGNEAYCLLAILCGASTFTVGSFVRSANPNSAGTLLYAGSGFLAMSLFIVIAGWLQGISPATLVQGVILSPMKHRDVYYMPFVIRTEWVEFAAIITASLVCVGLLQQRRTNLAVAAGIDAIRCVVGIGTCLAIIIGSQRAHWLWAFLPLSLVPGVRWSFSAKELFPRLFLTNLAATEFLVAYPIAGSQTALARSLLLLWAFLCIVDGTKGLAEVSERFGHLAGHKLRLGSLVGSVLLFVTAAKAAKAALRDLPPPSTLNGSSLLHLAPDEERDYGFISRNVAVNCSVLFTMPGMGSFNLWSGVPTPNGLNLTAWMKGLDAEQQQQILNRLQSTPDACVVYSPVLVRFWQTRQEELMALPLAQYILFAMPKVADRGDYEIRVHPSRESAWILKRNPERP